VADLPWSSVVREIRAWHTPCVVLDGGRWWPGVLNGWRRQADGRWSPLVTINDGGPQRDAYVRSGMPDYGGERFSVEDRLRPSPRPGGPFYSREPGPRPCPRRTGAVVVRGYEEAPPARGRVCPEGCVSFSA
jgi:hypothetical protein